MRGRGPVLGGLALGGVLALVGSAQPWWQAQTTGAQSSQVGFTGVEASGGLSQALGLVVLAGLVLALTLRTVGRRVLAVLLALSGLAMVAVGAVGLQPSADALRARVRQVSLADQFAVQTTAWPWAYATAGALVTAASILLWLGAPHWAARASRFDRRSEPVPASVDLAADPALAWQALDAGADPTADPAADPGPDSSPGDHVNDPDVHIGAPRVTMGHDDDASREGRSQEAERRSED